MYIIALANSKQIYNLIQQINPSQIIILSRSIFEPNFINFINQKGIQIKELINDISNIQKKFTNFIELTDYFKNELTKLKNEKNYEKIVYLSTSVNPLSSDIIAQEIENPNVIMCQTYEDLINNFFSFSYKFKYQLPFEFKPIDFLFLLYHFNLDLNFSINFIIPNIPFSFTNIFNESDIRKVSDIAKVFCFIPKKIIEKTLLDYLWSVMIKLRYNCQWDKIQTSKTIKNHLIEEAYEVLDSIEKNDSEKFKSELGDLLLQIIFHSQIQSDFKNFNFYDVLESLIQKLINRHPHVFSENKTQNIEEILVTWEKTKSKENQSNQIDLPKSMPSLLKMYLLYRKIKRIKIQENFDKLVKSAVNDPLILKLHELYLTKDENLENQINNFLDYIIEKMNQEKLLPS